MVALRLTTFSGALPIRDLRLLPDEAAVKAVNVDTSGGSLKSINKKALIKSLNSTTRHVYKLPYDVSNNPLPPSNLVAAKWLEFADINTDVLRTPNVNDSFDRYYWASPSTGFKYATRADLLATGIGAGISANVEVPPTALFVAATGGTSTLENITRSYMQTFVSVYGEESQPGPTYEATGKPDGDWTISSIDQPVNAVGTTQIDRIRIYRTITAASGVTTFFLVNTYPVGTTTVVDDFSDVVVSANQQIQSTLWAPPPAGLQGIVSMPNGIFVGWVGNTLYFSENYRPHAWPAEYALSVQFPIVGLGVFGQTCVVCTTGNPATVSGIKSANMALTQGKVSMPCLSRKGIVSTLDGVYYPSPDGLVAITGGNAGVVTAEVISKEQWNTLYTPENFKAAMAGGLYSALFSNLRGVFLDKTGVIEFADFIDAKAMGVDEWSSSIWVIDNGNLYNWLPNVGDNMTYTWQSKEFSLPVVGNMAVAQLFFDEDAGFLVALKVWAGRRLVFDHPIDKSGREVRLPSGFKSDIWQIEVTANVRIHNVNVASSAKDLRSV